MEFFDDYKEILLLFLSTLAEIWSEGGELDSDAQAYPSRESCKAPGSCSGSFCKHGRL